MEKKIPAIKTRDIIKKIRKPTPPPTKFFQDETKNIKKDRKKTKEKLKQHEYAY